MADRDYDEIADPALIARLAAWFGEGPLPPVDIHEVARAERAAAIERLEEVMDHQLVNRLESANVTAGELLIATRKPQPSLFDNSALLETVHLDVTSELDEDDDRWSYEQPEDIDDALRDANTPQAVLRDLYRPVRFFGDIVLRGQPSEHENVDNATVAVRSAMATSWSHTLPPLPQTLVAEDMENLRSELLKPWAESEVRGNRAEGEDEGSAFADHSRWFGIEGGYDPDQ